MSFAEVQNIPPNLWFFGLTWIALAFLEDVFKSRLEETVAHFVSVSVGSREIFEGNLFLGIAVPFLGCESAHRVSRGGYQSWSHSYLVLCPRGDVKPSLPVLMKTHHLVLLGIKIQDMADFKKICLGVF